MDPPFIGADRLRELVPVRAAVDALAAAFAAPDPLEAPLRAHHETPRGSLLLMPAFGAPGVGVKLVTITPSNPGRGLPLIHAVYVLFDGTSQAPVALIEGAALTALRTASVSALATRHLARPDAAHLVIVGAGVQGQAHLESMVAVRPIERVRIASRTRGDAEALADRARSMGLEADAAGPDAVAEADLICTCTTSTTPVFDGSLVPAGAHVNAVGAYTPEMRELDEDLLSRARIVVETREAALAEAGDLLIPIRAGRLREEDIVADLTEVVRGAEVRRGPEDVTVFKSVGLALEDLAVARAAFDAAG